MNVLTTKAGSRRTREARAARTRRNVWKLEPDDKTLFWYGRAVAAMKRKPIADPTSWRYQAAIHEYVRARDPLADTTDVLPSRADQRTFWTQCQHGSWYFLPWHRMYLHHFETIVATEVAKLSGPADWALPYWNYSVDENSRLLPVAFRSRGLADGSANPLYVAERDDRCNAGHQFADGRDVELGCLKEPAFDASGGSASFGGPGTDFEHSGDVVGALEATPHGSIHMAVGGVSGGWMSQFYTAALDPMFWLHHANIDRLWEVWLKRDPGHVDPKTKKWLTSVAFKFHDVAGKVVTMKPVQVVDTTAAPLSYVYDDISDPLAETRRRAMIASGGAPMAKQRPAEMVGATTNGLELGAGPAHTELLHRAAVRMGAPGGAQKARRAGRRQRIFLNVENITSAEGAGPYDVYLNVPARADRHVGEDLFVGRLPLFGLTEASRVGTTHAGSGLHYVFDVTDLYERLAAQPGWDPNRLRISFVPKEQRLTAKVRVGRVSLYLE